MDQAGRNIVLSEGRLKQSAESTAAENLSALKKLRLEFDSREQVFKEAAQQALQAPQTECKVRPHCETVTQCLTVSSFSVPHL